MALINPINDRADHIGGIEQVIFDDNSGVTMIMTAKDSVIWTAFDADDSEVAEGIATDRASAIVAAKVSLS